jgi:CheY-like chemotaxis protein
MPGIDGYGVAQYIRNSKRPHTPIIGISASPWLMNADESDSFAFDSFIPKPFNMQALLNVIEEVT